jgi:hypothetical protein
MDSYNDLALALADAAVSQGEPPVPGDDKYDQSYDSEITHPPVPAQKSIIAPSKLPIAQITTQQETYPEPPDPTSLSTQGEALDTHDPLALAQETPPDHTHTQASQSSATNIPPPRVEKDKLPIRIKSNSPQNTLSNLAAPFIRKFTFKTKTRKKANSTRKKIVQPSQETETDEQDSEDMQESDDELQADVQTQQITATQQPLHKQTQQEEPRDLHGDDIPTDHLTPNEFDILDQLAITMLNARKKRPKTEDEDNPIPYNQLIHMLQYEKQQELYEKSEQIRQQQRKGTHPHAQSPPTTSTSKAFSHNHIQETPNLDKVNPSEPHPIQQRSSPSPEPQPWTRITKRSPTPEEILEREREPDDRQWLTNMLLELNNEQLQNQPTQQQQEEEQQTARQKAQEERERELAARERIQQQTHQRAQVETARMRLQQQVEAYRLQRENSPTPHQTQQQQPRRKEENPLMHRPLPTNVPFVPIQQLDFSQFSYPTPKKPPDIPIPQRPQTQVDKLDIRIAETYADTDITVPDSIPPLNYTNILDSSATQSLHNKSNTFNSTTTTSDFPRQNINALGAGIPFNNFNTSLDGQTTAMITQRIDSYRMAKRHAYHTMEHLAVSWDIDLTSPQDIHNLTQRKKDALVTQADLISQLNQKIADNEKEMTNMTTTQAAFRTNLTMPHMSTISTDVRIKELNSAVPEITPKTFPIGWYKLRLYGEAKLFSEDNFRQALSDRINDLDMLKTIDKKRKEPLINTIKAFTDKYETGRTLPHYEKQLQTFQRSKDETLTCAMSRVMELLDNTEDLHPPHLREAIKETTLMDKLLKAVSKPISNKLTMIYRQTRRRGLQVSFKDYLEHAEDLEIDGYTPHDMSAIVPDLSINDLFMYEDPSEYINSVTVHRGLPVHRQRDADPRKHKPPWKPPRDFTRTFRKVYHHQQDNKQQPMELEQTLHQTDLRQQELPPSLQRTLEIQQQQQASQRPPHRSNITDTQYQNTRNQERRTQEPRRLYSNNPLKRVRYNYDRDTQNTNPRYYDNNRNNPNTPSYPTRQYRPSQNNQRDYPTREQGYPTNPRVDQRINVHQSDEGYPIVAANYKPAGTLHQHIVLAPQDTVRQAPSFGHNNRPYKPQNTRPYSQGDRHTYTQQYNRSNVCNNCQGADPHDWRTCNRRPVRLN